MSELVMERAAGSGVVQIRQGDLTAEAVDAIVNAANRHLAHGGGVAGAIVRKGGEEIQRESDRVAPVPVGGAAVTGAGRLPCRYVIHAVGPRWGEGDEPRKLDSAIRCALDRADELELRSIALPAISTGIFGYPKEEAAGTILAAIREWLASHPRSSVTDVRLVLFDAESVEVFRREFARQWPDG